MQEAFYDRYAELEQRHWWFVGRRAILNRALELLAKSQPAVPRLLEVGCGTGGMLPMLDRYGRTFAADVSATALTLAAKRGVATSLVQTDGSQLPFADRSFDIVCAFDVLEHIADDRAALREIARVCRPGGRLMVSVPAFRALWGQQDVVSHHHRRYRRPEIDTRLREVGFTPSYTTYFNTWMFPAVAAIRLARRAASTPVKPDASDFDTIPPRAINALLARLFASEASAIGRTTLPIGVSILSVASRS